MLDVLALLESGTYRFTEAANGWVYMSIPKEHVKELFDEAGVKTTDPDGVLSDSYSEGDVQFAFDPDTNKLEEIFVFPVFEDEDSCINGADFIEAPEEFWLLEEEVQKFRAEMVV